jgi:hypothetical protein
MRAITIYMTIKMYTNIQDLTGIGEEWLINPVTLGAVGVFIDGNLRCEVSLGFQSNCDQTKVG